MTKQLELIAALFSNLKENAAYFVACGGHYMDKNHVKTAIRRKITLLRQELLNLERMLENG